MCVCLCVFRFCFCTDFICCFKSFLFRHIHFIVAGGLVNMAGEVTSNIITLICGVKKKSIVQ